MKFFFQFVTHVLPARKENCKKTKVSGRIDRAVSFDLNLSEKVGKFTLDDWDVIFFFFFSIHVFRKVLSEESQST